MKLPNKKSLTQNKKWVNHFFHLNLMSLKFGLPSQFCSLKVKNARKINFKSQSIRCEDFFIKTNVLIWNFVTQTLHVPWIGPSVSILCEDHPLLKFPSSSPLLSLYAPHKNREGPDVPMNFFGYISVRVYKGGSEGGEL